MKKYLFTILLFAPIFAFGQAFEAELLGHWHNADISPTSWLDSRYNDVWGTVQNGHEFAIFGSTEGVHFIDVTDPTDPNEVAFVQAAATGPASSPVSWRPFDWWKCPWHREAGPPGA